MNGSKRLRRARIGAIAWGVFLLALTSWPKPPPIFPEIAHLDKAVHFGLYAMEAFLLYRAVAWPGGAVFSFLRVLAVTGTMAVWAAADELHQHWIPGRSMEGSDVVADVAGAAFGALVASGLAKGRESGSGM